MAAPFSFNFPNKSTTQPAFSFSQQPNPTPQPQHQSSTAIPSTAIDLEHLRPTTKFDAAQPAIQQVIERLDTAILTQMKMCDEIPEVLDKLASLGDNVPAGLDFVSAKLEHLTNGLENDAEAVVGVRDGTLRKGEGEAKCVFRAVDRLKVPRQYQVSHKQNESMNSGVYGGSGLSGWWNNPQTLKASTKADAKGETMQLPGEEVDDSGPKSLVELFNTRAEEMALLMKGNRALLGEIEDFVGGLEDKVRSKERQLNERLNLGVEGQAVGEQDHQLQLLKYVFGEVDRSMYEVAGKVGATRDDVLELGRTRI